MSESVIDKVLDTEYETRNDEYESYKCIVYPSQLDFSNLDLLYVKEEMTYTLCDPVTTEVVQEDYFFDEVPASEYINLQCYCDLGSIPNTYGTSDVSF